MIVFRVNSIAIRSGHLRNMRSVSRVLIVASLAAASAASAATLDVVVRNSAGAPLPDAVVMVESAAWRPAPLPQAGPYRVAQHNIQFDPHVLVVPVGASVTFPNLDRVRHHVYSFSKPKRFELKLYGREDARTVVMDKPGVVALGCNIHDQMSGYVVVADTPWAAKADAAGHVVLTGVPGGGATLRVWHPLARAKGGEAAQPITLPASGTVARAITLDVKPS